MNIAIEDILAAIIQEQDGEIYLSLETYEEDRSGKIIAIEYFEESHSLRLTLAEESELKDDNA